MNNLDFFVSGHGFERNQFPLPYNVRVVALCSNGTMRSCMRTDFRLWNSVMFDTFGSDLRRLYDRYGRIETEDIHRECYEMCVFSPNFTPGLAREVAYNVNNEIFRFNDGYCPNIVFSEESSVFRSGIFSVPVSMNRLYIADHISKTTGTHKAAGTIEAITENKNAFRYEQILKGVYKPTRLERLISYPIPTLEQSNLSHNQSGAILQSVTEPVSWQRRA